MNSVATSSPTENNDIYDVDINLVCSDRFTALLNEINSLIQPNFYSWDNQSLEYQKYRQILMSLMIFTGLFAIIFTIPEINKVFPDGWGIIIQNSVAFFVFVLLLIGIKCNYQKKWLLFRHKSELLRLLKFHTLLDPMMLSESIEIPLMKLKQNIEDIDSIDQNNIGEFVKDEFIFWKYDQMITTQLDRSIFFDLIKYYQEKRLKSQIKYFGNRIQSREKIDRYTKSLPKLTTLIGVIFLCLYFIFSVFSPEDFSKNISSLVVVAALLPALGSSIKSYRTTNEISRIASIYKTRQKKLITIINKLSDGLKQENINFNQEFELIHESERILKDEHQEWLRLMIQSEWIT